MASPPTIRSLAHVLELSRATVSAALRGTGRIAPATVARVRAAAKKAGYKHNPLAAMLMSELRRSRGGTFRGVLAAIEPYEVERPNHGPFQEELFRGAKARATELGFKLELFVANWRGLTVPRLDSILQSRGIHGVLLLPSWKTPDFSALSWSRYAGVYTDYNLVQPHLHSICSDHYRMMLLMLERLHARGYRRPGLFIEHGRNERVQRLYTAAFSAFYESYTEGRKLPVPALVAPELSRPFFEKWFLRHKPDVVLCHFPQTLEWMKALGAHVPKTHGFVCLNLVYKTVPCAGLDLRPQELGARAIELLIAQLQRNELGIPSSPIRANVPSRWVDGPTLRS